MLAFLWNVSGGPRGLSAAGQRAVDLVRSANAKMREAWEASRASTFDAADVALRVLLGRDA